jgi:thioredoxin-like negative regulator of GroEL
MSLLLQALQKAARAREGEESDGSAREKSADDGLELEPLLPEPTLREEMDGPVPTVSSPTPAQAATVVQAGRSESGFDAIEYAREHYMLTFIGCAVLFALGYGTYVYLQVAQPFSSTPPPPVRIAAPAVQTPTSAAPEPAKISGLPTMSAAPATMPAPALIEKTFTTEPPVSTTKPSRKEDVGEPLAPPVRRPRAQPAAAMPRFSAAPSLAEPGDGIETFEIPAVAHNRETTAGPGRSGIVPVSATLMQAYEAMINGEDAGAKTLYEKVLALEPRSIDALLGLGALAWKQGHAEDASNYYQQVLRQDPRNSYAQAGLIAIIGGADPEAAESRLKQLIARDSSAFLYFSLGNLYAERELWAAAQQAYFQAYQLQSDFPDYAFNLAIGLEHLGQEKLALDYYRKALDLSFKKGHANFDQNLVIQRVAELSARVEK